MIDEDDVLEALANVIDPELGLDFVELGLVYGVEIDGSTVSVTFTLTTPACPIGPQVSEQMESSSASSRESRKSSRTWSSHPRGPRTRCPRTRSSPSATSRTSPRPPARRRKH